MSEFIRNYIKDNRPWVQYVLQVFMLAVVIGGLAFFIKPDLILSIAGIFDSKFGPDPGQNLEFSRQLFVQNTEACILALIGGILFAVIPSLIVFLNGFIIGFIVLAILAAPGHPFQNIAIVILGLAPHGIFELPAFFLSATIGTRLGIEWLQSANKGRRLAVLKDNLIRVLKIIPVLILLLAIAALIEVFVSGKFVDKLS